MLYGAITKNRVGTIKPRHLDAVISSNQTENSGEDETNLDEIDSSVQLIDESEEALSDALGGGHVLTPSTLRQMARKFAGMPVTNEALEELLLLYYDVVEDTERGNDADEPHKRQGVINPRSRQTNHRQCHDGMKHLAVHIRTNQDDRYKRHHQQQLNLVV